MFIELHLIQNFAPSNLNRDDTGNPKDTEFGGVRRARISSQCIKRAIRLEPVFAQATGVEPANRTRFMTRLLVKALTAAGKPNEEAQTVANAFAAQYSKMDKQDGTRTSVLIYLSQSEISQITAGLLENWDIIINAQDPAKSEAVKQLARKISKATQKRTSAPDIALFGRMLAENPELNLDAACQVAHAISTHRVNMEMDFFTAVDDLSTDEETGAGMMGVTGFNSACFYRYARLDWRQLVHNLGGDTLLARRTVEGFLRAALQAVPTGKQNAFAAQNPPSFALAVAREDGRSWSLANAFEKPIRPDREVGYVASSILALDEYWGKLTRVYGENGLTPLVLRLDDDVSLSFLQDADQPDLESWLSAILEKLPRE